MSIHGYILLHREDNGIYSVTNRKSIFSKSELLMPVTSNDPRFTCDPITTVEGLKLITMYESYGHAM